MTDQTKLAVGRTTLDLIGRVPVSGIFGALSIITPFWAVGSTFSDAFRASG